MKCKLVTILGAQIALLGECEQGGAKCRRESIVKENSEVPPPPRFELLDKQPLLVKSRSMKKVPKYFV